MTGRRVGVLLTAVTLAIGALLPAAAAALTPGMQPLLNADGTGRLFATAGGTESFTWEQCAVDQSGCSVVGTGRDFSFGNAPASTVFRLAGGTPGEVSPIWHGNLTIAAPPSIAGKLRANELVTPVPATWLGGWEGDLDQTQLAACATPAGEGCVSLTDPKYVGGCERGGAVLDPSFAGNYLRVADRRLGPGTVETLEAAISPYGHPIWPAAGNTAVAMVGQIGPATHRRSSSCGAPRQVEAWISSTGIAKVSCALGCEATLVGSHGKRRVHGALTVPSSGAPKVAQPGTDPPPSATLRLPPGKLKRLGAGKARFVVEVGGATLASRKLTLPDPKKSGKR
jgi:hypothetical protein